MRKYSEGKETIFQLEPELEILDIIGDEKVVRETQGYDEEHHTDNINQEIFLIYTELKNQILAINPNLIFNPTKYYISIKGRINYAFIKIRKKSIRLVVMRPEDEIRKHISKYEVKSNLPSVKRFWNGECAEIFIENSSGLDELVNVLKPLIVEN